MHPAEHRALRELHAATRQLREHWTALAGRLEAGGNDHSGALRQGASTAGELLAELGGVTAARGLFGGPAAHGVGANLAATRAAVLDHTLEVNQALRVAALDVQHVVTLLGYTQRLAHGRGDAELETFLSGWEERLRAREDAIRATAVAAGDDPDRAIRPATPGLAGRVGHGMASAAGTVGEWLDRKLASR